MPNKIVKGARISTLNPRQTLIHWVTDESEAVRKCLSNLGYSFNLATFDYEYKMVSTPDGEREQLVSALEFDDKTAKRWVGIDKILSAQDVTDDLDKAIKETTSKNDDDLYFLELKRESLKRIVDITHKFNFAVDFISDPRREPHTFIPLNEGEKVFNKAGQQIWPKP